MEKLLVSPINEIREINESEEVGLTSAEIRLVSKAYNTYWKRYDGARNVKSVYMFFWEELERWGHPVAEQRNLSIKKLSRILKQLRIKFGVKENERTKVNERD